VRAIILGSSTFDSVGTGIEGASFLGGGLGLDWALRYSSSAGRERVECPWRLVKVDEG